MGLINVSGELGENDGEVLRGRGSSAGCGSSTSMLSTMSPLMALSSILQDESMAGVEAEERVEVGGSYCAASCSRLSS
jgi:hypothetical protein